MYQGDKEFCLHHSQISVQSCQFVADIDVFVGHIGTGFVWMFIKVFSLKWQESSAVFRRQTPINSARLNMLPPWLDSIQSLTKLFLWQVLFLYIVVPPVSLRVGIGQPQARS